MVSARADDELQDWLVWAEENGSSFVRAIAEAASSADIPTTSCFDRSS
jgi:hypothetical protein